MSGLVLFLDGVRGNFVIYEDNKGRHYVYRTRDGWSKRFYIERGQSVDWIEVAR